MFIAFGQPRFGAPAERNVLIDNYVEQITFRSAGANNLIDCGINYMRSLRDPAAYSLVTNA